MSQSDIDFSELIKNLEDWTRLGKSQNVLQFLKKLIFAQIPRVYRFQLADIARRNSLPLLALKMMNPVVRGVEGQLEPPADKEKIIYATSLTSIGCQTEAIEMLSNISVIKNPEVDLFLSFAYFGRWEYERSLPKLKRYINSKNLTDYQRLVGRVNLLAALVDTYQWNEVDQEIAEISEIAKNTNYTLLLGNIRELQAQSLIARGHYSEALVVLNQAGELLQQTGGLYYLFVRKWKVIVQLLQKNHSDQILSERHQLKKEAAQMRAWEVVRDLDFYLALSQSNEEMCQKVLLATPNISYKNRAEKILGCEIELPKNYKQSLFPGNLNSEELKPPQELIINYQSWSTSPQFHENNIKFKPTLILALDILSRDGYKPVSLGTFYNFLYPKTYFAPMISEKRVHNVVFRLREYFKQVTWPLGIVTHNNEFFLKSDFSGVSILKYHQAYNRNKSFLDDLHRIFQSRRFTATAGATVTGLSKRFVHEQIRLGISKKRLVRIGSGRSAEYRFSNRKTNVS